MSEYWKGSYLKEEEFLEEFSGAAWEAARVLKGDWKPNSACTDKTRHNRDYFLSTGELNQLTFDSAAVYHDENGFSSVQIILKSSKRTVNVRVRKVNGSLIAEKILDKEEKI